MNAINIYDIQNETTIWDEELSAVKGGGLLLPAVQKVREAAARTDDSTKGWIIIENNR